MQDLYGDDVAREMELQAEYAPAPLFGVGSPELAGPELTRRALAHGAAMNEAAAAVVERAASRLDATVAVG